MLVRYLSLNQKHFVLYVQRCVVVMYLHFRYFVYITAPSVAPSGLTIVEIESRSFSISWNEYSREHWNGEQGGFRIEVLEVYSGLVRSVHLVGGYSTYVEVFSLHPNFTYIFKIAAYNSRGMGNFSEISIQLSEDGRPRDLAYLNAFKNYF